MYVFSVDLSFEITVIFISASAIPFPPTCLSPAFTSKTNGNVEDSFCSLFGFWFSGAGFDSGLLGLFSFAATTISVESDTPFPSCFWNAEIVSPSLKFLEASIVTDHFPSPFTTTSVAKIIALRDSLSTFERLIFAPATPVPEITASPSFTGFTFGDCDFSCSTSLVGFAVTFNVLSAFL